MARAQCERAPPRLHALSQASLLAVRVRALTRGGVFRGPASSAVADIASSLPQTNPQPQASPNANSGRALRDAGRCSRRPPHAGRVGGPRVPTHAHTEADLAPQCTHHAGPKAARHAVCMLRSATFAPLSTPPAAGSVPAPGRASTLPGPKRPGSPRHASCSRGPPPRLRRGPPSQSLGGGPRLRRPPFGSPARSARLRLARGGLASLAGIWWGGGQSPAAPHRRLRRLRPPGGGRSRRPAPGPPPRHAPSGPERPCGPPRPRPCGPENGHTPPFAIRSPLRGDVPGAPVGRVKPRKLRCGQRSRESIKGSTQAAPAATPRRYPLVAHRGALPQRAPDSGRPE